MGVDFPEFSSDFRLALEAAPTGMLIVDREGRVVFANAQVMRIFGYSHGELVGTSIDSLVPRRYRNRHPALRAGFFDDPQTRLMGAGRDLYGLRKDDVEVPLEIGLNPFRSNGRDFVIGSVVDITERKRAEQEREQLLAQLERLNGELQRRVKERDLLLTEVHHRVKNNLQLVSSLINLHAVTLDSTSARHALSECQLRIQAIALIHEKLLQAKGYASVPFSGFIRSLTEGILTASAPPSVSVSLVLDIDPIHISVDKAIPCGLLLTELLTNALKYAFVGRSAGTIRIELCHTSATAIRLGVSDDGRGLPAGLDPEAARSLGLRLVHALARQLDGEVEFGAGPGTAFRVVFEDEV